MHGIVSSRKPNCLIIKSTDNGLEHIIQQEDFIDMSEQSAVASEVFILKRNEKYNELSDNSKNEIQRIISSYAHDICRT